MFLPSQSVLFSGVRPLRYLFGCHVASRFLLLGVLTAALPSTTYAIDVNQASATELSGLQGLGPKTSALIIKERLRAGPFESLDHLAERVPGLGVKKVLRLQAAGLRAVPSKSASDAVMTKSPPAIQKIPSPARDAGQQRPRRPIAPPAARPAGL